MARLSTYHLLGGFDPDFRRSEDTDFNIRLAKIGGHFVGIAKPMVLQYMTKTPEKSLKDEQKYTLMLLDKHRDVPDRYGLYNYCCHWIDLKRAWLDKKILPFIFSILTLVISHPVHTFCRLFAAIPNIGLNKNFGRFHSRADN